MSANEQIRDAAIRHALYLQRYSTGLAQQIIELLNSVDEDLVGKIAQRLAAIDERGLSLSKRTQDRLETLLEEVRAINSAIYGKIGDTLSDELSGLAGVEAQFQSSSIAKALPASFATATPTPNRLRAIVESSLLTLDGNSGLLSSWVKGMEDGRASRVEAAIRKGLVQGHGTDEIARAIRGTKAQNYQDGILQISRRSAQSIVRTSVTHISNVAAQQTWAENDRLLKGWQFLATLDNRTTITCAGLSGNVYPIGEGPIPPLHVACRSTTIPVTKSWKELGIAAKDISPSERASIDGQVASDITFDKWLIGKGDKVQNEILGPTRAKLFRAGTLNLTDFIRNDGTVLTLAQLRDRHDLH